MPDTETNTPPCLLNYDEALHLYNNLETVRSHIEAGGLTENPERAAIRTKLGKYLETYA